MHRKFKVAKRRDIDMTEGSIFSKILAFSVPLMATGILQLLFNAADMAVVGKYVSETALAAVGSTGSLVSLIVNFFIGLSAGAGVIMSKYFGSKDEEAGEKLLHTAMPVGLISGVLVAVAGALLSNTLLILMNTPENCLAMANEYLVIYFIGAPFNLVYNFGASMLRSTGDTVRPLIYLSIAGVINVIVNLVAVIVFNMGVSGVAYATITSQAISAVLVVRALMKNEGFAKLKLKKLCIHKGSLLEILRLGIPSGVQSSLFSVSNMVIQGTINTFGDVAMAANAAARQIEGFVYVILNSVATAAVTAVGQNYGARNYKRIRKCIIECLTFVLTLGIVSGMAIMLFSKPLINIYTQTDEATVIGIERLNFFLITYVLCGLMDVLNCSMRGMGFSFIPMVIVLVGTCVLRVLWIYFIFPLQPTLMNVYMSYPVSWVLTAIVGGIVLVHFIRKREREERKRCEGEKIGKGTLEQVVE